MGMNYYLVRMELSEIKELLAACTDYAQLRSLASDFNNNWDHDTSYCVENAARWHIGKSGWGWKFSLHVKRPDVDSKFPKDLNEWLTFFEIYRIENEEGETVHPDEMLDCILRKGKWDRKDYDGWVNSRHDLDFTHCIDNSNEGYDLIIGEFS